MQELLNIGINKIDNLETNIGGNIIIIGGKEDIDIRDKARESRRLYYALNKTILGKIEIQQGIKFKVYNAVVIAAILYDD